MLLEALNLTCASGMIVICVCISLEKVHLLVCFSKFMQASDC